MSLWRHTQEVIMISVKRDCCFGKDALKFCYEEYRDGQETKLSD